MGVRGSGGGDGVARTLERRTLVTKHLLALRWMNPNALVYLHESHEKGEARVDFELCTCGAGRGGSAASLECTLWRIRRVQGTEGRGHSPSASSMTQSAS